MMAYRFLLNVLLIPFMLFVANVYALEPLVESELDGVVGQAGVALDFEFRMNADENGAALASLSSCSGNNNPCKLALQFNNRTDEWLVLKDIYGIFKINNIYLDSATASAGSPVGAAPVLELSFPGTTGAFATAFETDIEWHLYLGRSAVEYGATGYLNDANGTFLGVQVTDLNQRAAMIDVDGSLKVFGF